MNNKRFPILVAIAAVAIAIAVFLGLRRAPEQEGSLVGGPVIEGLAERLNNVASMKIVKAGDKPFLTLNRIDGGWTVAERDGYPADPAKVRLALINLGETRILEAKTSNPDRYAQLGVEDVAGVDAKGALIELIGKDVDARLIVGNRASQGGEGTYIRRAGETESWLATGNLVPDSEIGPWLKKEIVDIASTRIREIEIAKGDGRPLRVFKDAEGDANFKVADVPRGRETQSDVVANGLGSMLSGLTLEDVAKDTENAQSDAELHRATYSLFDGLVVNLTAWQEPESPEGNPGTAYARLSVDLDEEQAKRKIAADIEREQAEAQAAAEAAAEAKGGEGNADGVVATGTEAEVATKETPATETPVDVVPAIDVEARTTERLAAVAKEKDELNARLQGWRFQIPAYKFGNVDKTLEDMLKPRE
jgi:hypothetical protein